MFPHGTYINLLKQAEGEKGMIASIGIVTAPFKGSNIRSFELDQKNTSLGKMIANDLVHALQRAFPNAQIRLHNSPDDTIIGSLARLVHASRLTSDCCLLMNIDAR